MLGWYARPANETLKIRLFCENLCVCTPNGLDPLHRLIKPLFGTSRKRVHRLKKEAGIRSLRHKAYKVTTNSNHNNTVSPNLLGGKFKASRPNQTWVSDITYIATGEGWLYCAIVKDLFTKKIVGFATSER